ncbi:MAG: hypothetical protein RLZZ611_1846 [Cyanobacteriota bacterium]|jgi:hypothetical protein
MTPDDPNSTTGPIAAQLPPIPGSQTLRVDGTNVVRVPFGVRQARRSRPARPERWATVVLPFQSGGGSTPPPPQAA